VTSFFIGVNIDDLEFSKLEFLANFLAIFGCDVFKSELRRNG